MIGIYRITSPNGSVYIGQTRNSTNRFSSYKGLHCKGQFRIYNSLLKYGYATHVVEMIHELPQDIDQSVLDNYEIFFIEQYRDCGIDLMNLKEGGRGGKMSDESKQRMSEAVKYRPPISESTREKIRNNSSGRKHSEETKMKMKTTNSGHVLSEEHRAAVVRGNKTRVVSEETRLKMSESQKRRRTR